MSEERESRGRILVVEDEAAIRRFYRRFLEPRGYELVIAPTGDGAMRLLESGEDFDVILLDIRLPGVSGRALWKLMQMKRPELCSRVILVSGDILGESTQQLVRQANRPYLEKPFTTEELLATIEAVLEAPRSNSYPEEPGRDACMGE